MLVRELCRFDNQPILVSTKGSFTTRKKDKAEFDLFATPSKILINTLFLCILPPLYEKSEVLGVE